MTKYRRLCVLASVQGKAGSSFDVKKQMQLYMYAMYMQHILI